MKPEVQTSALSQRDGLIAWIESHPGVSDWLKEAVKSARDRDPVSLLNDLEILRVLMQLEANAELSKIYGGIPRHVSGT